MMRSTLLARTGTGMSMEATEVAEEVARARDRSTLGTWLERRFARHPGYDIQVSTPSGEALFRSARRSGRRGCRSLRARPLPAGPRSRAFGVGPATCDSSARSSPARTGR